MLSMRLKLLAVLCMFPLFFSLALAEKPDAEDPGKNWPKEAPTNFKKGKELYKSPMAKSDDLKGWVMEGPGKLAFKDGWMQMQSPDEKGHHVFWCPKDFPESFVAQWDVQNLETDAGLCIVFFAAKGLNGEDIFDPKLPKRAGVFKQYTKGKIVSYHISYYANAAHNPNRPHANLRKNNTFTLVQKGRPGIPTKSEAVHKLTLVKDGGRVVMFVDDNKVIDWADDGKTTGPVHTSGKIGLRQMKWSHFRYRNFGVWELKK
jgi:Domain of unknown function (DUF1961)